MNATVWMGFLCRRFFLIATITVALGTAGEASTIDGYLPVRHDRFSSGDYSVSPVENPDFFLKDFDFSGIGRSGLELAQPLTMISPIHFLAAKHFTPTGTVTFVNQDNQIKTYTIDSTTPVVDPSFTGTTTDLLVGTLTSAIPAADKIAFYPTFSYSSLSEFDNAELLVYGQQDSVGRNELDGEEHLWNGPASNFYNIVDGSGSTGFVSAYDFAPATGFSPDESRLGAGDSGYPTFIRVGTQLGLAGIHWAIGTFEDGVQANFDTFVPRYQPQIDALLDDGLGYSIQTISIPEPSSITLLFIAGIPFVLSRRVHRFSPRF